MPEFREKICIDNVVGKKKTAKALLCEIEGDEYFVPDSQIDDDSEVFAEGDEGTLIVSLWWAEQEKLA